MKILESWLFWSMVIVIMCALGVLCASSFPPI